MSRKNEDYDWLDDPFDEKKAAKDREDALRSGNGKAALGCLVVVIAIVVLLGFGVMAGVDILRHM